MLSIGENCKPPSVVYSPEGLSYFDNILLYKDAAVMIAVNKARSEAQLNFVVAIWAM